MYYMISGGVTLPRERLSESQYSEIFEREGERHRLLKILLGRMICSADKRVQTMGEIVMELDRLVEWERNAAAVGLSANALANIARVQSKVTTSMETSERLRAARELNQQTLIEVERSVMDWIAGELEKTADLIKQQGGVLSGVRRGANNDVTLNNLRSRQSAEIWVRNPQSPQEHVLRFNFAIEIKFTVRTYIGNERSPAEPPMSQHTNVSLFPTYALMYPNARDRPTKWRFFTSAGGLHTLANDAFAPRTAPRHRASVGPHRLPEIGVLSFSTQDWPEAASHLREYLSSSIERFMDTVSQNI